MCTDFTRGTHLSQMPKFLTLRGFLSVTSSTDTISPVVFLNLRSWRRKYQNLDLATTASGAKMRMRKSGVSGSLSVGSLRPITRYSLKVPDAFMVAKMEKRASSIQRSGRKRKRKRGSGEKTTKTQLILALPGGEREVERFSEEEKQNKKADDFLRLKCKVPFGFLHLA